MFNGLFDLQSRLSKIDENGDPLALLSAVVDWERFRPALSTLRDRERRSAAGRKPFDAVLMFRILVLGSLYNLSDDALERQILDRLSFMRFVGLGLGDAVPDAKTIWLFRQQMADSGLTQRLFDGFESVLRESGFAARKGQIVDATIVEAPRQRNTREENEAIKDGKPVEGWSEPKRRQKDVEARWTKKNDVSHFGWKNHISVDVENKLIRRFEVTDASVHDSRMFDALIDESNTSADVWADAGYASRAARERLEAEGYRPHIQRKGTRGRTLTEREKAGNRTRAKTRARVEHVFGHQRMRAGTLILRGIGLVRARCRIVLRNLAYNLDRFAYLVKTRRATA